MNHTHKRIMLLNKIKGMQVDEHYSLVNVPTISNLIIDIISFRATDPFNVNVMWLVLRKYGVNCLPSVPN